MTIPAAGGDTRVDAVEALCEIAARSWADKADKALMLFNNCYGTQAALNAQRVQKLLEQMTTPLHVVPPPKWSEQEGDQRLLF